MWLFADDLMLYFTNTKTFLPKAIEAVKDFSKCELMQIKDEWRKTKRFQLKKIKGT